VSEDKRTPFGVVAIFIDKEGDVVASVSDFKQDGYGGFSLFEAQKIRVERKIATAVMGAYCSAVILDALDDEDCRRIVRRLVQKGARISIVPIGHDERQAQ
jgi:hypothetical protein